MVCCGSSSRTTRHCSILGIFSVSTTATTTTSYTNVAGAIRTSSGNIMVDFDGRSSVPTTTTTHPSLYGLQLLLPAATITTPTTTAAAAATTNSYQHW
mmetsp:Transcript_10137/g.24291  ORF Transcript_10137/g.24291 Transcript_10137/m.24291 type:complete len:98 (-) Transcript_10137:888-1181(-)